MTKTINYRSCFDVIGPVMIGPSSSHTAGALKIGQAARQLLGSDPTKIICHYYESFAETHQGHGTDFAIVAGSLGFETDDKEVPYSMTIAKERGVYVEFISHKDMDSPVHHANTADLRLSNEKASIRLIGASVGGGTIEVRYYEVDNFKVEPTGPLPIVTVITEEIKQADDLYRLLKEEMAIPIVNEIDQFKKGKFLRHFELGNLLSDANTERLRSLKNLQLFIMR
ncbi:serine dehydratase [Atopobacter sp. AH10]|uniref:serine dehydratase beta chain n=1 Tax=Atopobacter sp. AH10 TaxID=2315861 RepID=UPI000EF22FB5|nr:serine dehydratase beta chain [Atopobacter sp. AH10]RLK62663.1 serine dehydratase [Atopobacter sp. AH10]